VSYYEVNSYLFLDDESPLALPEEPLEEDPFSIEEDPLEEDPADEPLDEGDAEEPIDEGDPPSTPSAFAVSVSSLPVAFSPFAD
jgi:hypothetical protein